MNRSLLFSLLALLLLAATVCNAEQPVPEPEAEPEPDVLGEPKAEKLGQDKPETEEAVPELESAGGNEDAGQEVQTQAEPEPESEPEHEHEAAAMPEKQQVAAGSSGNSSADLDSGCSGIVASVAIVISSVIAVSHF